MSTDQYELIDFGRGRKLESICGRIVDRPSPAARDAKAVLPQEWKHADSRFDETTKTWHHNNPWDEPVTVDCGDFKIFASPTPFGHIGLFSRAKSELGVAVKFDQRPKSSIRRSA